MSSRAEGYGREADTGYGSARQVDEYGARSEGAYGGGQSYGYGGESRAQPGYEPSYGAPESRGYSEAGYGRGDAPQAGFGGEETFGAERLNINDDSEYGSRNQTYGSTRSNNYGDGY